jgi:hypothetical protein
MVIVSFTLKVTDKTANNTKKLPNAEAITKLQDPSKKPPKLIPNIPVPRINNATPKLAPLLNPKTKGPANGFLNNVCINKPQIDKPEPTKMAVIAFGNRKFKIIVCQLSLSVSSPNRIEKTSLKGIRTEPKLIFTSRITISKTDNNIKCFV